MPTITAVALPLLAAAKTTTKASSGSSFLLLLIVVAIGALLFTSRNRKNRMRAAQTARSDITPGRQVMTTGGLFGRVIAVEDDEVELEIADGVVVRYLAAGIARVVPEQVGDSQQLDLGLGGPDGVDGAGDEFAERSPSQRDLDPDMPRDPFAATGGEADDQPSLLDHPPASSAATQQATSDSGTAGVGSVTVPVDGADATGGAGAAHQAGATDGANHAGATDGANHANAREAPAVGMNGASTPDRDAPAHGDARSVEVPDPPAATSGA